ncbi:MAG: class I SAM-dependent methyltransferase [Oscillospiraceae bacterium]|nr:class I SAM-dependent methyltransferase [Oscillospiraceae bacterium]
MKTRFWNHNTAYYSWVNRKTAHCHRILDVGCGDGTLACCLSHKDRVVIGLDISESCIDSARRYEMGRNLYFEQCSFQEYEALDGSFDAIIFVASIHHMDFESALLKAKRLLAKGGVLVIVGLASPSSIMDHVIDLCRVIPCYIGSKIHRMTSSEELGIPTSYAFPNLSNVRTVLRRYCCHVKVRYGLYWRYLVAWRKTSD